MGYNAHRGIPGVGAQVSKHCIHREVSCGMSLESGVSVPRHQLMPRTVLDLWHWLHTPLSRGCGFWVCDPVTHRLSLFLVRDGIL